MKSITTTFSTACQEDEGYKAQPRRFLEKKVLGTLKVKLVYSSSNSFTVIGEDSELEEVKKLVLSSLDEVCKSKDREGFVHFKEAEYKPKVSEEIDTIVAEMVSESEERKEAEREKAKEEEIKAEAEEDKNAKKDETELPQDIEKLLDEVPMKHSEDLKQYLRETDKVIPMLIKMNNKRVIWTQNLLVSVDTGFGLTTFLRALVKIHIIHELVTSTEEDSLFTEYTLHKPSRADDEDKVWNDLFDTARRKGGAAERGIFSVLCIDISEYTNDLNSASFTEKVKKLADLSKNYICVFRVPFMEKNIVSDMAELLSDTMNVRLLCVPPIPMDDMVGYMRNRLKKFGIESDDSCNENFERELIHEKKDDSFFGYKTLNKVIDKVIYEKAIKNAEKGQVELKINKEDIADFEGNLADQNADPIAKLRELVGIEAVSQQVLEIVAQMKFAKEEAARDSSFEKPTIHMMFTGNPGTGKTTVARLVARIMKEQGILRKGYMHEYRGRDLCGRYIGETAPKTSAICRDAYGSVLFIDEAYSLYRGEDSGRDYGREALDTLVAEMENHRDDMCVIFAGYKDEMEVMLHGNSGLRSRIPYIIEFPNYTREQLVQIFFKMLGDRFKYDDNFKEAVSDFFNKLPDEFLENKEFSNARFVRNLYEKIWGKAAYRKLIEHSDEMQLLKADVENVICSDEFKNLVEKKNNKIGFI